MGVVAEGSGWVVVTEGEGRGSWWAAQLPPSQALFFSMSPHWLNLSHCTLYPPSPPRQLADEMIAAGVTFPKKPDEGAMASTSFLLHFTSRACNNRQCLIACLHHAD